MKKRLFAIALSLCMTLSLLPTAAFAAEASDVGGTMAPSETVEKKAEVDGVEYPTVAEAIEKAQDGDTVTLLADVNGGISVPQGKDIVLDLNGKTVTNTKTAVYNSGKLTIKDNTKTGKIVSTGSLGISIGHNSTTVVEYAQVTAQEFAVGTSYATGSTITIEDGVFTAKDNAVIGGNGNPTDGNSNQRVNPNTINIEGGTFNGTIKSAGYVACGIYAPWKDTINVSGGTFNITGGAGIVARAGTVNVTGGEFNVTGSATGMVGDSRVVVPCSALVFDSAANYPVMTNDSKILVAGGTFTAKSNDAIVLVGNDTGRIEVKGGAFSSDPADYVANGYGVVEDNGFHVYQECQATVNYGVADKENYTFNVYKDAYMELPKFEGEFTTYNEGHSPYCWLIDGKEYFPGDEYQIPGAFTMTLKWVEISEDMPVTKVETTPGDTAAEAKTDGKSDEVADAMTKAADALKTSSAVNDDTLTNSADEAIDVDQVLADNQQAIQDVAKATNGDKAPDAVDYVPATLVVEPYMKVEVTDANVDTAEASVTMDITPMVKVTVTTSPDDVNGQTEENTKVLKDEPMEIKASKSDPIEMTLPVPELLKQSDKLYIQHKGYEYDTQKTNGNVTFTNPHGFSEFTMSGVTQAVTANGGIKYTDLGLAINEAENGTTLNLTKAPAGEVTTNKGGKDVKLTNSTGADITVQINGTDVTIKAGETADYTTPRYSSGGGSASTGYTVTVNSPKNGSVSVTPKNASKGDTVTITVKADKGYELDKLTVTDKDGKTIKLTDKGNGKYIFTMPGSKVEVKAEFVETTTDPANPFRDVSKNDYYYKQVLWAVEKGITSGVSANEFAPDAACTRAQMVTFLWKAAGSPEVSGALAFNDVSSDAYYAKAVRWAAQQGITSGTSAGVFSPDAPCTRGQMAMFLYAYAKTPAATGAVPFADVNSSDYFNTAVLWAVNNGITSGTSSTTYSPNAVCTRGQMVVFLYQLLNK